jgi:hypothetical protein
MAGVNVVCVPYKGSRPGVDPIDERRGRVHVSGRRVGVDVRETESRQRPGEFGIEVVANTPDDYAASMRTDIARTSRLIKDAGIRVE